MFSIFFLYNISYYIVTFPLAASIAVLIRYILLPASLMVNFDKKIYYLFSVFIFISMCVFILRGGNGSSEVSYIFSLFFILVVFYINDLLLKRIGFNEVVKATFFSIFFVLLCLFIVTISLAIMHSNLFVLREAQVEFQLLKYFPLVNSNQLTRLVIPLMLAIIFLKHQFLSLSKYKYSFYASLFFSNFIIISALSRVGIFVVLLFYFLYFFRNAFTFKKINPKFSIALIILFFGSLYFISSYHESLRLSNLYDAYQAFSSLDIYTQEYLTPRVRTWFASILAIKEQPILGHGIDGAYSFYELNDVVKKSPLTGDYNVITTHGGWFKILVYSGVLPFFSLLYFFYYTFNISKRSDLKGMIQTNHNSIFFFKFFVFSIFILNITGDSLGLSYTWVLFHLLYRLMTNGKKY